jgi:hypothetical protein
VVLSYKDSESVDFDIRIKDPARAEHQYPRQAVPVTIEDGRPTAHVSLVLNYEPLTAPTASATERGGKREAFHRYE